MSENLDLVRSICAGWGRCQAFFRTPANGSAKRLSSPQAGCCRNSNRWGETDPTPLPSVCKSTGTIAVACVLLRIVAFVVTVVKMSELGSLHSAVVVEP